MVKVTAIPSRQVDQCALKRDLRDSYIHQGLLKWLKPSTGSVAISITVLHLSYYKIQLLVMAGSNFALNVSLHFSLHNSVCYFQLAELSSLYWIILPRKDFWFSSSTRQNYLSMGAPTSMTTSLTYTVVTNNTGKTRKHKLPMWPTKNIQTGDAKLLGRQGRRFGSGIQISHPGRESLLTLELALLWKEGCSPNSCPTLCYNIPLNSLEQKQWV